MMPIGPESKPGITVAASNSPMTAAAMALPPISRRVLADVFPKRSPDALSLVEPHAQTYAVGAD